MARMNCKLKKSDGSDCGVQIDYNPDTKTAKNIDGTDHFHPKNKNKSGYPAKYVTIEEFKDMKTRVGNLEQAFKALVATSGGQATL